jgi:gliding motility-associated-like protein
MNYSWLTGPTTQSVVAKAPGHWMVTITDPSTTCSAVVDSLVIIYPNPNAVFEADTVCLGMVTTFVNSSTISSGFIQLNQWDFGDNSSSLSINPTHTYSVAGDTTVHLYTKSNYGCWDTAIQRVLVHPNPIVLAGSDVTIMLGNNVILNGQGATTYLWSPNIGLNNPNIFNPVASPLFTTVYELTGADINGCRNKDTLTITVIGSMTTNLLTANGDGYNDKWLVTNIENYPGTEVIVVNREGQQVYYNSSYDNSWDGTNNGKALPDGTYYYFIKFNNGKIYKGPITILNEKK